MICPDCDPEGFRKAMDRYYGPPTIVAGVALYPSFTCPDGSLLDVAAAARSFCPTHAPRPTSALPQKDDAGDG